MIKYIGIDGCKSGWFYVGLDQAGNSSFGVFCEIRKLKRRQNTIDSNIERYCVLTPVT
jgi:hypothetical protein